MYRTFLVLFLLSLLMLGCEERQDPAKVKQYVQEQDAKFVEAFNKKDVDGIMAPYWNSPDLVAMYPDTMARGYDAIKAIWQKTFEMVDVRKFEINEQHIEVSDHMVSEWGLWSYQFQPKGGPEISLNGRYLQVWEEKNGKWVLTADHASVPLPPPPPPAASPSSDMKGKTK